MVTGAEVRLNGRRASLEQSGWVLSAEILSPEDAVFEVVSTDQPRPQARNAGTRKLVVRLPEPVTGLRLVVALTPHRKGKPIPNVRTNPPL
jgi:hypothetical protein